MPNELVELLQTCGACPSQWEGRLKDGRYIYARYRWGHLTVGSGASLDEAIDNYTDIHDAAHGDDYDGTMSTETMLRLAGLVGP